MGATNLEAHREPSTGVNRRDPLEQDLGMLRKSDTAAVHQGYLPMSPTAVPTCFKADAAAEASQANGSPEEVSALQILVAGPGSMLINGVFGECYKKK